VQRCSERTPCEPAALRYTIVLHFDTLEHLEGWLAWETRQRLMAEVERLLASGERVDIKTGLEFWFTPHTLAQK
jgi:antibiotic biosynthesis monooxygenase (ABM) superfamily enzyme